MDFYDGPVVREIAKMTCAILHKHFYYEDESILKFLNQFIKEMAHELTLYQANATDEMLESLINNDNHRFYFTCIFASKNMREIMINRLNFSEQELRAFELFLPKYAGEMNFDQKNLYTK